MSEHKRKFLLLGFLAVIFTLIAYQTAIDAQTTANTALNMTCTYIVNNTDLAPFAGTGERVSGVTYYANDTSREVWIITVNPNSASSVDIDFFINGSRVQDDDLRTSITNQNTSKNFNVPLGSVYMANISTGNNNYQWREYKQICNRPGQLNITNLLADNNTFVPYTNATRPVDITPFTINSSGFNAFGDSNFNSNNISNLRNVIGDHFHIITNASLDNYFNVFSAGNSSNVSSIRVSSNATTIASIEKCTTGCHAYNLSWIRVWPAFIDISTPNVYFTGSTSITGNISTKGNINVTNAVGTQWMQMGNGFVGSINVSGSNFSYFSLNLYNNGTGWNLINASDTGVLLVFGSMANSGSNTFVLYQTQTPGLTDFVPVFGSDKNTPGNLSIGGFSPAAKLDIQGGGTLRISKFAGMGGGYACFNNSGEIYFKSSGCP